MEKECGRVKITETDEGYRIDVTGKNLKEMMACCIQMRGADGEKKNSCCAPEDEKK